MSSHPNDSRPDSVNLKDDPAKDGGVSRRRLMRAGLSAAPLVAVLKSNSVLAGDYSGKGCIKPSSFASYVNNGARLSNFDPVRDGCGCRKPADWCHSSYDSKTSKRLGDCGLTNLTRVKCRKSDWTYGNHRLKEVLSCPDLDQDTKLGKYLVACYLSAGDGLMSPFTQAQCKSIWASGGTWKDASGTAWSKDFMLTYLDHVFNKS